MAEFYDEKYYVYLQVDPSAEQEVIEGAFKRLLKKYHPDNNPSPEADEKMKNINAAYAVLKRVINLVSLTLEKLFPEQGKSQRTKNGQKYIIRMKSRRDGSNCLI